MTNSVNGPKIYQDLINITIGGTHPLFEWEQFDFNDKDLDEYFLSNWWKDHDI